MIENVDLSMKKAVLKENELVEKREVSMGLIRGRKRIDPDSDMDGHNETRSTPSSDWIFESNCTVINNDCCNYVSFNSLYNYHTHI